MRKLIILALLSSVLASCGKNANNIWPTTTEQEAFADPAVATLYEYSFSKNSCQTGNQSASTFVEICKTLKDNSLNNNCAIEERENLFISAECEGIF